MKRVLILGGTGYTGKLIAKHLLEQSDVTITLASRHVDRARNNVEEMNRRYSAERVIAVYADAADRLSLQAALHDQDLIIVAAPTTAYTENVVRAALDAGVDYLDVQLGAKKFAIIQSFAEDIKSGGLCFITEAAYHPGLPAALVRYAAVFFDTIETATIVGYLNLGKSLPYSEAFDELIESLRDYQAQVYKGGRWTKAHSFEMKKIDLGSDIGIKNGYSMFFEELKPIPALFPTICDLGFFITETHWMTDWVIIPIAWIWSKALPDAVRPIGKLLWWGMRSFHKPPYRIELQIQATGKSNGLPRKFSASLTHADGYEMTAIPVVAALLQYLDGSARKSGVWMMGHIVEPVRLMEDIKKMGVDFKQMIT